MQDSGDADAGDDNTSSCSVRTISRRQRKNRKTILNTNETVTSISSIEKENKEPILSSSSSSSLSSTVQHKASSSSKTRSTPPKKRPTNMFMEIHRIRVFSPPLREYLKLNLPESMLVMLMHKYTLTPDQLNLMGYPFEYTENMAAVYKFGLNDYIGKFNTIKPELQVGFDVNAQEFVPNVHTSLSTRFFRNNLVIVNKNDGLLKSTFKDSTDSGQGSGSSSPPSGDSDTNDIADVEFASNDINCLDGLSMIEYNAGFRKTCIRCRRLFAVTDDGQYLTDEHCCYHWGRRERVYKNGVYVSIYTCCGNDQLSNGCSFGSLHVWTGIKDGFNGPYDHFITTKPANIQNPDGNYGVFALDCEMSFTSAGLEVTKVTLVNLDGHMAYEKLIRPTATIIDYNTRFSGITEKDLCAKNGSVKTLAEVQRDLLQMISEETVLVGHALDNDLRVLKLIHKTVIDTSKLFPHDRGLPFRRSLKSITKSILKRDIQMMDTGHSSFEDSRASLELLLWLIRNDLRSAI